MASYPKDCGSNDDCIIKGNDGWNGSGDQAIHYMGDTNHYIKAKWGFGLIIGTAGVGDLMHCAENSGNIGLGSGDAASPQERLHLDGRILFESKGTPSDPSTGKAVMWWDGSDLKVKRNAGDGIKTCTITGGWA